MPDALTKAFYEKSKVILVRPLGGRIALGSVGYFSDGQWLEVTTTEAMFGIKLVADRGSAQPNSFSGMSGKRLKFEAKAAGEASAIGGELAKANARIEITFGSVSAFVMNVKNQRVSTARALGDLIIAIRHAYRFRDMLSPAKRWERKYAVVVGLATADSVTALLSASKDATAIVSGGTTSTVTTVAQLDASMSVSFSQESVDNLWQGPADCYAFQALRIEPSFFRSWDWEDVEYVNAAFGAAPLSAPAREQWAKSTRFNPATVKLVELRPSGRPDRRVQVSAFGARSAASDSKKSAPPTGSRPKRRRARKGRR